MLNEKTTVWKDTVFGKFVSVQRGHDLPEQNRNNGDIPIIGSFGITGFHNKSKAQGPGVTIGRSGASMGVVSYSDKNYWPLNTVLYVTDFHDNNPKFVYYLLKTIDFTIYNSGSAQPSLNRNYIYSIPLRIPNENEQRAIAATLSALDDKIELNNRINKTLEEMAQAIFKQWFVDFQFPDENGQPYKSGGGEMEGSELGLIPKGWKVGVISDLGQVVGGSTPSKANNDYYTDGGIPWITPKDLSVNRDKYIGRGAIDITEAGLRNSSAQVMPKGTVLFSSRAPIGYIAIAKNNVTTNQGFKSVVPHAGVSSEFIYYLLKWITPDIENRASGSTFKEISGGEMKKVPVIFPKLVTIKQFEEIVSSFGVQMQGNEEQNNNLISLRDALLPKLMSGEIRVPIEEVAADV